MVMDYGRSAYRSLMDFAGDGSYVREVRWYKAADGALPFPGPHCFGMSSWRDPPRQGIFLGEQWNSSFKWDSGTAPPGALGQGPPCGPLGWFLNGVPPGTPPLVVTAVGLPECCGTASGVVVGGYCGEYLGSSVRAGISAGGSSLRVFTRHTYGGLRAGSSEPGPVYLRASTGGTYLRSYGWYAIPGLGLKLGLLSARVLHYAGALGIKVGLRAALRNPYAGALGIKVGLSGHTRPFYAGALGIKLGLSSALVYHYPRQTYAGALGIKLGLVSNTTHGTLVGCCPGHPVPNSLVDDTTQAPTAIPFTYSAGVLGWQATDPISGNAILLQCVQTSPGVYQWHLRATPSTHCTINQPAYTVNCGPPFSIDISVTQTGALCTTAGSYHFVIHA